jgi:hypothetical protein
MKQKRGETAEQFEERRKRRREIVKQKVSRHKKSQRSTFIEKHAGTFSELFPLAPSGTAEYIFGEIYDHDAESQQRFQDTRAFIDGKKRKRSVMFASDLSEKQRIFCAVVAHLRHETTEYDRATEDVSDLKYTGEVQHDDTDQKVMRRAYNDKVRSILTAWGLVEETTP